MKGILVLFGIIFGTVVAAQHPLAQDNVTFLTLDRHAESLLDKTKANLVFIGVVYSGQTFTRHYGEIDKGKANPANDSTLFEIGSVTKIFTGTLMANAVLDGKLNLDDDIRKYIQGSYPNLEYLSIPVRIRDLISFKTAFDRELPDNSEIKKKAQDSTAFLLRNLDAQYSKQQFFEDLKGVKLDTTPGVVYKYSNLSMELSAHILETVYQKTYETLLNDLILSPLGMHDTKLYLHEGEVVANGYNDQQMLMPMNVNHLWGSGGYLKSSIRDLVKFLNYELDPKNNIVQETQRNISDSDQHWVGYYWDGILIVENGIFCHKQGSTYGTQTFFAVYPELKLGIVVVVNQNAPNTYGNLFNTVLEIAEDLKADSLSKSGIYGYRTTKDKVIFTYTHPQAFDASLIKSVHVAGSFNGWTANDDNYKMATKGNHVYELELPKSLFNKGETYLFKFVVNKVGWLMTPKTAQNVDDSADKNLTLKIE